MNSEPGGSEADAVRRPGLGDALRRAGEMRRAYRRWPVAWCDRMGVLPTRAVTYEVHDDRARAVLQAETNGQDVRAINEIWLSDLYERHLPSAVARGKDLHVADLGANKGYFATWAAAHLDVAHLVCVEADAGNADVLDANLEANGLDDRSEVVRAAVVAGAAAPETVTLFRASSPLLHTTVPPDQAEAHGVDDGRYLGAAEQVEVPAVSLGDVVERTADPRGRVQLLKVDVEGIELDLLREAPPAVLARIDHVVAETSHRRDLEVEGLLEAQGFTVQAEPCFLYATKD